MAPLMLLQQPLLVRAAIRDADWRMALMVVFVSSYYYRFVVVVIWFELLCVWCWLDDAC